MQQGFLFVYVFILFVSFTTKYLILRHSVISLWINPNSKSLFTHPRSAVIDYIWIPLYSKPQTISFSFSYFLPTHCSFCPDLQGTTFGGYYRHVLYMEGWCFVPCWPAKTIICDSLVLSHSPVFFTLEAISGSELRPPNRFNSSAAWSFHYLSVVFSDALFHFYVVEKFESSWV